MAQTILTAILEVEPASESTLRARISNLRSTNTRDALKTGVPTLHFLSLSVFKDHQYDPILVLEANFDGAPGPFWAQLEAVLGVELREMLRLCRARGRSEALFTPVTRPGSAAPIAPLLEAATVLPAAKHQGNRGLDRNRILNEGALFAAVQGQLNQGIAGILNSASGIHQALRSALLPQFPWLDQPPTRRIGAVENLLDKVRLWGMLGGSVILVLFLTAAPGLALRCVAWECGVWDAVLAGALSFAVIGGGMVLAFRRGETLDPPLDAPQVDPAKLEAMERAEDQIAQNHMISLVLLKPGAVRALVARASLLFIGLSARAGARNGYLKSMRTIHFAHWALVGNGSRLMFHSNYDGSWESYLDDFIEKAHAGLTAAWTHGVGFPPTKWLVKEGATSGRKFKAWARSTMSRSEFWYSAYPEYSVNQIERHARVAKGLRKPALTEAEAATWALDL
jgi:hypothetical protein